MRAIRIPPRDPVGCAHRARFCREHRVAYPGVVVALQRTQVGRWSLLAFLGLLACGATRLDPPPPGKPGSDPNQTVPKDSGDPGDSGTHPTPRPDMGPPDEGSDTGASMEGSDAGDGDGDGDGDGASDGAGESSGPGGAADDQPLPNCDDPDCSPGEACIDENGDPWFCD